MLEYVKSLMRRPLSINNEEYHLVAANQVAVPLAGNRSQFKDITLPVKLNYLPTVVLVEAFFKTKGGFLGMGVKKEKNFLLGIIATPEFPFPLIVQLDPGSSVTEMVAKISTALEEEVTFGVMLTIGLETKHEYKYIPKNENVVFETVDETKALDWVFNRK